MRSTPKELAPLAVAQPMWQSPVTDSTQNTKTLEIYIHNRCKVQAWPFIFPLICYGQAPLGHFQSPFHDFSPPNQKLFFYWEKIGAIMKSHLNGKQQHLDF